MKRTYARGIIWLVLLLTFPTLTSLAAEPESKEMMNKIAVFTLDVTPPIGHPLCAGWYPPATGITDRLTAKGILLTGKEKPVVLVALDWAEISNYEHFRWRKAIADAVGTDPERVGVHCTHAHNTPWPDREAQTVLDELGFPDLIMKGTFCEDARRRVADAARAAQADLKPFTEISTGQAKVKEVASNRRILGEDGKVKAVRWTKTKDPAVRAEPEGVIDPVLRTLVFWNGNEKLAVLHFYTVHPTSFDGDGLVTPDFTGLAREQRQAEDGGVPHLYFTGCAGNITAGKYNDGNPVHRPELTRRVYEAMVEAEKTASRRPLNDWSWSAKAVRLPPREDLREPELVAAIRNPETIREEKSRTALIIAYLRRADLPVQVGCLRLGPDAYVLSLPGETFIEYQLDAQARRPGDWVATAAYGDLGPGYIPLAVSYAQGGYEPKDSFVSGGAEPILRRAIEDVLPASAPARGTGR